MIFKYESYDRSLLSLGFGFFPFQDDRRFPSHLDLNQSYLYVQKLDFNHHSSRSNQCALSVRCLMFSFITHQ